MADFYVDDLDISPSDFIDSCSKGEITELIEILKEGGYINYDDDEEIELIQENLPNCCGVLINKK